jgi:hypothetical protein
MHSLCYVHHLAILAARWSFVRVPWIATRDHDRKITEHKISAYFGCLYGLNTRFIKA